MPGATLELLREQIELSEQLCAKRASIVEPQDLPGRYGRVVKSLDHLLGVLQCESVLGGGWAVWYRGFAERVTRDLDIALPASQVQEFLRIAPLAGFECLSVRPGHGPKIIHKETGVEVDILPEGARPGTAANPAPTTIPSPVEMGAKGCRLAYMSLGSLIELKLAAQRAKDVSDVVALIQANPDGLNAIRAHLAAKHERYVQEFDGLVKRAEQETDR